MFKRPIFNALNNNSPGVHNFNDSPLFNVTVKFFVCPSQATLGLLKVTEVLS